MLKFAIAFALATVAAAGPGIAQEQDAAAPAPESPPILEAAPATEASAEEVFIEEPVDLGEPEVIYATPETDYSTADVWWGNRSISHDNYIKFERIVMAQNGVPYGGPPSVGPIYFDGGKKSVLRPEAAAELDKAIAFLNAEPGAMAVIVANGEQSGRSESAIRNYLQEHGISPERITTSPGANGSSVMIPYSNIGS